jgi:predicted transcriptional regulator YdeE
MKEKFRLMGIKLDRRTSNANGQASIDCGELWRRFIEQGIAQKIPDKISDALYAVYYDYESDEKGHYSYFIGCRVPDHTALQEGLDELIIPQQSYTKITASGPVPACIAEAWVGIWSKDLNRKFGYDFEVYDERSRDWNNGEIDIYLSVNS